MPLTWRGQQKRMEDNIKKNVYYSSSRKNELIDVNKDTIQRAVSITDSLINFVSQKHKMQLHGHRWRRIACGYKNNRHEMSVDMTSISTSRSSSLSGGVWVCNPDIHHFIHLASSLHLGFSVDSGDCQSVWTIIHTASARVWQIQLKHKQHTYTHIKRVWQNTCINACGGIARKEWPAAAKIYYVQMLRLQHGNSTSSPHAACERIRDSSLTRSPSAATSRWCY